jgi:streptogramin lyase
MRASVIATLGLFLAVLVSGCGLGIPGSVNGTGSTAASTRFSGHVYGGQQPVSGSIIQLYTVGTGGNGTGSTALIGTAVNSDGSGNFSITGKYNCASATQVYITATGGNAGSSGTNANLSMMAALGSCSTLLANAATEFININELTTVAAVYSLAPFMTNVSSVGASGSNPTGLVNAFQTATALVNTTYGIVATPSSGVTLPVTALNTLADIVAACVNTNGASSPQCTALFGATGATDTVDAALYIAKNPATPAVTALYSLSSASPPFIPHFAAQPNDFTLAITYSSADLQSPYGVAIDAAGNAWVTNESGSSVSRLSALSSTFTEQAYSVGGLLSPRGVSIDRTGNIWVANTAANNVVKLTYNGGVVTPAVYTAAGLNGPVAIANDSAGNAWVANLNGNSVIELSATGGTSNTLTSSISLPTGLALDASGNVAVANAGSGAVCLFSNAGVPQSCPSDGRLFGPTGVAISAAGALAMSGSTTGAAVAGAFTLGDHTGAINAASPVSGGGLTLPQAVAYDAAGTAWMVNTGSISAFAGATAITPANGYGSVAAGEGIAVDASGNIWTANSGDNSVSIFVGVAAPTPTPIATAVGP